MNYAADALWWRLTDVHTRALAGILTAPFLRYTGHELSVRALLGGKGFRRLLALNDHPMPLYDFLPAPDLCTHVGTYAENLLAFWLQYAPHAELLEYSPHDGQHRRADFVARLNHQPYHIQLRCEYSMACGGDESTMQSLGWHSITTKDEPLPYRLPSEDEAATIWRQVHGQSGLRSVTVTRGMVFLPPGRFAFTGFNPHGWHGYTGLATLMGGGCRCVILSPHEYLAPVRKAEDECIAGDTFVPQENTPTAILMQRSDGFWHETMRAVI